MKQLNVLISNQKLVKKMRRKKRMNLLPLVWLVSLSGQQLRGTQCVHCNCSTTLLGKHARTHARTY